MKMYRFLALGVTILVSLVLVFVALANQSTQPQPDQPNVGEYAYITHYPPPVASVADTNSHDIVDTIDLAPFGCSAPVQAAMHPDGVHVYVSCPTTNEVIVIDTTNNSVMATIPDVIYGPYGITFTSDGAYAFVGAQWTMGIKVIDTTTYSIVNTIPTTGYARKLATSPQLEVIYAAMYDYTYGGSVLVIDANTFSIVDSIPIPQSNGLSDVAVSPDGQWIYVTDSQNSSLIVIDATTNTISISIPGMGYPSGLEISPDGAYIYVIDRAVNGVHVIERSSWTEITTVYGVGIPYDGVSTCDGSQLFVSTSSGYVSVIDTQNFTVIDTIPASGWDAQGIAICTPFITNTLLLLPSSQRGSNVPGEMVTYQETLKNSTGITDTFQLAAGLNTWETSLSASSIGPLVDGDSITFTVSVTLPLGIPWYDQDSVLVTATSVTSPTVYSDTARFTTQAYAPPHIGIDPTSLSSAQYAGEIVTQELTISNGNGVTLTYLINNIPGFETSLESNLSSLDQNYQELIAAIPNRYDFSEGEIGYYIYDGGDNMYDNGNYLYTSMGGPIVYSNNAIRDSTSFGASGRYFTRKYPGLFILASDMQGVDYFEIFGDLGADGYGIADGTVLQTERNGVTYYGFVKRVYGAATPSVNHLIILADNPTANQTYSTYTGDDYQMVVNIASNTRLYYLLYAGSSGYFIDDAATLNIMNTFLDTLEFNPAPTWLSTDPVSGTVSTLSSVPIDVGFNATAIQPGIHEDGLTLMSNDPLLPSLLVSATMIVSPTATMGWVEGYVTDIDTGAPLQANLEALGQPYVVASDAATGYYKLWLEQGSYILQAYADGYITATASVAILAGEGTTLDIGLEQAVPRMHLDPQTFTPTLMEGAQSEQLLTIDNSGPVPLSYAFYEISPTLEPGNQPLDLEGRRILYDEYHQEYPSYYFTALIAELVAAGAEVDYNYQPLTPELLRDYDVLWITYGYTALSESESEAVSDWLLAGGAVLVAGESSPATSSTALLFDSEYAYGNCSYGTITYIFPHPISEGVDTLYNPWTCDYWLPGDGSTIVARDTYYQVYVVAQEQLRGRMVLVSSSGFEDWNIYSEDNFTLAMNSLAWLADPGYSDVPWLSVEPVSGTIAGHDSGEVAIRFDASGLNPGVYYAALAMENNDSAQPNPFLVPVTMTVVAVEPLVALEPEAQVASGEPGSVVTYTLSVYNVGNIADSYTLTAAGTWTATLPVTGTGILEPGEDTRIVFSVSIPADAADGSSDTTTVTAESTYPGVSATAEATTTAMVAAEPLVTLEPETQSASGEPGSVVTYTLTVQNMGNVADSYTLAVSGTWTATLQVTQTGTLAPGEEYPMILSVTILADAVDGSSDTAMVTAESTYPGVSATAEVVTTAIVPEWEVFLPEVISGFTP